VLIASELAANALMHSASAGEFFTIRCEAYPTYVWVECEDLGGPWHCAKPDDRPHGLDIIEALTGPGNWGIETTSDGDRIVWARLDLLPEGRQL
jgi:anti-sigma regulatory factor (Ser/Thr protein kinase)